MSFAHQRFPGSTAHPCSEVCIEPMEVVFRLTGSSLGLAPELPRGRATGFPWGVAESEITVLVFYTAPVFQSPQGRGSEPS